MNWQKTIELIPSGVQTESKRPSQYIEGVYPKYIDKGDGAYVYDYDGKRYVDYTCSLGAILLGHAHPSTIRAVVDRLQKGHLFGLPNYLETELAEKLKELIPCAEMSRFVKTGSEACQGVIKIARAYTGRDKVLSYGYHGWHQWIAVTTPRNGGCPSCLNPTIKDFTGLESLVVELEKRDNIAAVIIEPYIYEMPNFGTLKKLRLLCDKKGTVLIFDEVITGFRTQEFSAQKLFHCTPDIAVFSKAMANGIPMAAICGKKDLMESIIDGSKANCFVSSTFGGDLLGISAALATIKEIEEKNVIDEIWRTGDVFIERFNTIASDMSLNAKCEGFPCRPKFIFPSDDHLRLFWQTCLDNGVLFGKAQFISFSHGAEELNLTVQAMTAGLRVLKKYWNNPKEALRLK